MILSALIIDLERFLNSLSEAFLFFNLKYFIPKYIAGNKLSSKYIISIVIISILLHKIITSNESEL